MLISQHLSPYPAAPSGFAPVNQPRYFFVIYITSYVAFEAPPEFLTPSWIDQIYSIVLYKRDSFNESYDDHFCSFGVIFNSQILGIEFSGMFCGVTDFVLNIMRGAGSGFFCFQSCALDCYEYISSLDKLHTKLR